MTIRELLTWATTQLGECSETPGLDAALLVGEVLGMGRASLVAHPERVVEAGAVARIEALVARRMAGEPVAYLLGRREFFGRSFAVDRRVLIPRPETELLVERALALLAGWPQPRIVDIGTGSGAIALTLAAERPDALVVAADLSAEALMVAQANATQLGVTVDFRQGWLAAPLTPADGPLALLAANLPYVGTRDREVLAPDVRDYEPAIALFAGEAGLDLIGALLASLDGGMFAPGGAILLEIGYDQGSAVAALAHTYFPEAAITVSPDLAGHDRLVEILL